MAEPVVSFVVEELGRWLIEKAKLLHGVSDNVEHAIKELHELRCFLQDADAKASMEGQATLSNLVAQIREIAYDIEDVIATYYAAKVKSKRTTQANFVKLMKRYVCILTEIFQMNKVGSDIEKYSTRISELRSKLPSYGVIRNGGGSSSNASSTSQRSPTTYCHVPVEHFVGFEQDIEKLVAALRVVGKTSHRVVSIWGMGGSGKTTLAKKGRDDNRVRFHFDCVAWAYISQQCQKEAVWREILLQLIPSSSEAERAEINALKDDELAEKLYNVQQKRKCLVILDDIWTIEMWDHLKPAFPQGFPTVDTTSKILITTRNKEILPHADGKGHQHELPCLDEHQSWELLEKIVFSRMDGTSNISDIEKQKMRDVGKKMLKHCGGLPLAVILLGGLLSTKHEVDEWESLESNIKQVMEDTGDLSRMAGLSYEELPYYLKPCFLHLANYPEDFEIQVKELCMIWVAEGIIIITQTENPNKSSLDMMEEAAYNYFTKLVERSMVQVEKMGSIRGRIKTCRMHDVMRDFCLSKAKELNFVRTINRSSSSTSYHGGHNYKEEVAALNNSSNLSDLSMESKVRRLAIHNHWDSAVSKQLIIHKHSHHLRSLMHFPPSQIDNKTLKTLLKGCDLLKVLRFEISDYKFPEEIGKLIHLRYLRFETEFILLADPLPSTIGNLRCLYALDLRIVGLPLRIPNVIWMLEQLRHLYLPMEYVVGGRKGDERLKLANLVNFKTIVNIKLQDLTCILVELTNLVKLNIHLDEKMADGGEIVQTAISLNNLQSLTWFTSRERSPCSPSISNFPNIDKLALQVPIKKPISEIQFPPKLMKITLKYTLFSEDPMPTLGKLPNLRTLNVFWLALRPSVKEIVCYKGGFCQLESLSLSKLYGLEQLKVEEGALPHLRRLFIDGSLKTVSDGFKSIKSLEKIEIMGNTRLQVLKLNNCTI